jgi:hypothetical protein
MIYIYYLEKNQQPIYVGYTKNPLHREYHHRQKYGDIKMILIDEVEEYNKKQLETFYIDLFKSWGFNLINKNKGGGGPKNHTLESIEKIKNNRPKPKSRTMSWSEESRKRQSNSLKGKPKPEGFGEMMRQVRIGKPKPEGMSNKLSLSLKGKSKEGAYKPVLQYTLKGDIIKEWPSINHAAEATNSNASTISKVCRGIFKQTNGFIWKYKQ